MTRSLTLAAILPLLLATGCTYRVGHLDAISNKNLNLQGVDLQSLPKKSNVETEDLRFLGIGANLADPLDHALDLGDGNVMTDAVIYYKNYVFVAGFSIRGNVVAVPAAKSK